MCFWMWLYYGLNLVVNITGIKSHGFIQNTSLSKVMSWELNYKFETFWQMKLLEILFKYFRVLVWRLNSVSWTFKTGFDKYESLYTKV